MANQANGILSPWLRRQRINAALPYLKGRVLDYGCGIGVLSNFISLENYLGVDIDEGSLEIARLNNPTKRFEKECPKGEIFDTIALIAVIEHIDEPATFLSSLKPLLAPKGNIVLTTPYAPITWMHFFGVRIGLFSKEASDEHKTVLIMQEWRMFYARQE